MPAASADSAPAESAVSAGPAPYDPSPSLARRRSDGPGLPFRNVTETILFGQAWHARTPPAAAMSTYCRPASASTAANPTSKR